MPTNNFLPFAAGASANVESQASYASDTNRTNGNQSGVASSALVNKAARQSSLLTSQLAQFISDTTNTDMLDSSTPVTAQILAQMVAALQFLPPVITTMTSGTGTLNLTYYFFIATASATNAATYSDGTTTYTVTGTISSAKILKATGSTAPVSSGTLTKLTGSGDATITYYATRAPIEMELQIVGGGGGGGGGGTTPTAGGAGSDSTFGASGTLLTAKGGNGGPTSTNAASLNTAASIGASATGLIYTGGCGGSSMSAGGIVVSLGGGQGGDSMLGGGAPSAGTNAGVAARANTGGGGGGGCAGASVAGAGGNGGEGIHAFYSSPTGSFAWAVGDGGSAGTGSVGGAAGGSGVIMAIERYQ